MSGFVLHHGDCLAVMRAMPDNSVDAIVTDPPYHLTTNKKGGSGPASVNLDSPAGRARVSTGFMGMQWDGGDIAQSVELWTEAMRVLKPGGYLLAFAGSRTYHRMAVAIEDAGFEIRDQIMWLYGQGFPKSLDVSKALDKAAGRLGQNAGEIKRALKAAHDATGKTLAELNAACGFEASGYLRMSSTWACVLPPPDKWAVMRDTLGLDRSLDAVFAEAEREVIGKAAWSSSAAHFLPGEDHTQRVTLDITAPATNAAREWEGWGTALKPAHEPICMARKPLTGTVAANVLAHGTGALNIDACRVAADADDDGVKRARKTGSTDTVGNFGFHRDGAAMHDAPGAAGRWPANIIHDGSDAVMAEFAQYGSRGAASPVHQRSADKFGNAYGAFKGNADEEGASFHGDTGSAARFFYCAKASSAERDEGLDDFAEREAGVKNVSGRGHSESDPYAKVMRRNTHPTVKPVALMAFLVRLVTREGGIVLDPFMGSGTTGVACMAEGMEFIGIDMTDDYVAIAGARIGHAQRKAADAAAASAAASPQIDLF